jgi:hypothetical protein
VPLLGARRLPPAALLALTVLSLQCLHAGAVRAVPPPPSADGARPPLITGVGTWDLRALGSGPISLLPGRRHTSPTIRFLVPPGEGNRQRGIEADSSSGPPGSFTVAPPKGMSYLLRMEVLVEVAPDSGPGTISITGQTNGRNATEVLIRVRQDDAGRLQARWHTYDLLEGQSAGAVGDAPAHIRTENYTPYNSVVPGPNSLSFGVESTGEARLARATVLSDSGLRTTWLKPARLRLSVEPRDDGEMEIGKAIGLDFKVANIGDLVARDVRVRLRPLSKKASLLGRREYLFDRLTGVESATFFVMPKREGQVRFELAASSANANNPGGYLDGDIGSGDGPIVPGPPWLLAALISGLAILGWRRLRRGRGRPG